MAEHRPSTKYDAIFAFQSLSEFITTGKIELLKAAESHFDAIKTARYRIVAVVGLFDKGKTFLINRLFGVNLPSGKLFTTKGLSFLWLPERRMLVLDSAGVQATVSYRAQAVQPILDAQTTESLIFEMVSRIAHHVIFVVNDLTWFEQKYIAMLHQKYVQTCQWKELIVVHNLRSTGVVAEALGLFGKQITQCYDGELSHLGDLVFTADQGEDAPQVHHIGICDEATPAGERFNTKNCGLVLQMLELREMLGSNISLAETLQRELLRLLPKFVNVESAAGTTDSPSPVNRAGGPARPRTPRSNLEVEFVAPAPGHEQAPPGYVRAAAVLMRTVTPGHRVTMKTRGVISPLGEIIAHDVSFDPIVNIYDRRSELEVRRYIEIECPGVFSDDIEWEELSNGVRLAIQKRPAIDETAVHPVFPIRQHHGPWERDFLFDASEGRFELCDQQDFKLKHGVLTMVLRKGRQTRRGKLFGQVSLATPSPLLGTRVADFGMMPRTPPRSGRPAMSLNILADDLDFQPRVIRP